MKKIPKKIKAAIVVLLCLLLVSVSALTVRLAQLRSAGGDTAVVPDNLIGGITTAPDGATAAPGIPGTTLPPVTTTPGAQETAAVISLYQGHPGDNEKYQVHNMFPGDTETRYFAVDIRHSTAVTVYFIAEMTEQTKALGEILQISVTHLDTGKCLYDGPFADLDPEGYNELFPAPADGQTVAYYEIQVSLPASAGNAYQAASLGADFSWAVREQEALDPPQTGDQAPVSLWLALAGISVLGLAALLCGSRRKEGQDEKKSPNGP